ncbi:MAG: hypothetical protein M5U34_47720 [Chloroflexi bacterium]|nr:hypothetical protein [Chloroflexota bacterium]
MTLNLSPRTRLAAALSLPPLPRLSSEHCLSCQAALPLFITDEMAGLAVDALYPQTAVHLDICPTCAHEYEALTFLTRTAFYDEDTL